MLHSLQETKYDFLLLLLLHPPQMKFKQQKQQQQQQQEQFRCESSTKVRSL